MTTAAHTESLPSRQAQRSKSAVLGTGQQVQRAQSQPYSLGKSGTAAHPKSVEHSKPPVGKRKEKSKVLTENEKKNRKLKEFKKKTKKQIEEFKERKTKDKVRELKEDLKNIMIEQGVSVNRSSMTKIKQQCDVMHNYLQTEVITSEKDTRE